MTLKKAIYPGEGDLELTFFYEFVEGGRLSRDGVDGNQLQLHAMRINRQIICLNNYYPY